MSKFYQRDNISNNGIRIDARTGDSKRYGIRNAHRGMGGEIIGGVDADGQAFGTKTRNVGGSRFRTASPAPATGNVLNSRQNLFKEMTTAGSGALTPAMRSKAKSLGVSDEQFNAAAGKLKTNEAVTPRPAAKPATTSGTTPVTTPPAVIPAAPSGTPGALPAGSKLTPQIATNTPQIATNTPGIAPASTGGGSRINRLTGKPFGWFPGDDAKATPATTVGAGKRSPLSMAASPVKPVNGVSLPDKATTFRQTAGLPTKPSTSFAVPPTPNPQAIGTTPAITPPAATSQFAQLTAPKPIAAPAQSPAPTSSFRRPATPAAVQSGPSFTTPEAVSARGDAKLAARKASMQSTKDAAYNRQPDLPVVAPDSLAKKAYKNLRARWTTP